MTRFSFKTDKKAEDYCEKIVARMVELFGIPEAEAVGRINRMWKGQDLTNRSALYHDTTTDLAYDVYDGHDSNWWKEPPGLTPLPYP